MNIVIDDAIGHYQQAGGISTMWSALRPRLPLLLPEYTFDATRPADLYLSSYYQPAPPDARSIAVVYDYISHRFPLISRYTPDALWKMNAVLNAEAVIAISQWTANDVKMFQQKGARVAHLATDLARASHDRVEAFKARYGIMQPYVITVGRRHLYKNVGIYWQAQRLLSQSLLTVCVGGEDAIEGVGPVLHIHPDTEALEAAYTGALCLVYPSLYEGFGLPVLEAYACGCPVICGEGGALAEINGAACVVNVTKPREMAQALAEMMDPGVRVMYALRGYNEVKRFTWDKTAAVFADVIRDVLGEEV